MLACGDGGGGTAVDAAGTGGIDASTTIGIDADPLAPDANVISCGDTQCNNCLDDDGDGYVDGEDVECTGGADNDESSFSTGIPGDNQDAVNQDCFFDGNSGAGNDGCNIHVCCLLGATTVAECPIGANQFDPAECAVPQSAQCDTVCGALTPPGCDCFGCCTVCDPITDECFDIITNPQTAPNCDETTIGDPAACPVCTKVESCGTPCGGDLCVLCPGQELSDLPASCDNAAACPDGLAVCEADTACANASDYCANGCCIAQID